MLLVALLLFVPAVALAQCPANFTYNPYYKKCYLHVDSPVTFLDAESHCKQLEGHLVSIKDDTESAVVTVLHLDDVHNKTWIGLNTFMNGNFSWTSNESVNFTNSLLRANMTENKQCVTLARGQRDWIPEVCSSNQTYVCQVLATFPEANSTTPAPQNATQPSQPATQGTSKPDTKAAFGTMISASLLVAIIVLKSFV